MIAVAFIDGKGQAALAIQPPIVGEGGPLRTAAEVRKVAHQQYAARRGHQSATSQGGVRLAGKQIHPVQRGPGYCIASGRVLVVAIVKV